MNPEILVIRLSSLGDVVLTGAVYRNLKAHWPKARITVLTKPAYAPFLEGHPAVDEVLPFRSIPSAVREIRRRRFTHVLDLHSTWRSLLLAALSGAPRRLRYRKDALARRLFVWARLPLPRLERHTLERYLECLSSWDVPIRFRGPELREWGRRTPTAPAFRRVVVLQTAFLGDAMLTIPLLKRARRVFPEARLAVVCRPETAEVFRAAGVDEIIEDAKRGSSRPARLWSLAKRLRGNDLALLPHRSFRSALAAAAAGIPRRVGFGTSAGRYLLTDIVPFSWLLHDAERNLSLLSPFIDLADHAEPVEASIGPSTSSGRAGDKTAELTAGLRRPIVGLHPGSVWATKRWLPERYARVAAGLSRDPGATVILVGAEADRAVASGIESASGGACLNWTGRTGLKELLSLIGQFDLFITNDSGPMHVATAFGVPTLAIFGPTTKELGFFPYGEGHEVLEAELACRPCGLHGSAKCPEGHFLCMRLITTDRVLDAARRMLAAERVARAA